MLAHTNYNTLIAFFMALLCPLNSYPTRTALGSPYCGPFSPIFKEKAWRKKRDAQKRLERIESVCGRLLDAAAMNEHDRAIRLLAQAVMLDANPTCMTYEDTGDNALHCAAQNSDTALIVCLLEAGADAGQKNNKGKTPYNLLAERYEQTRQRLLVAESQQRIATYQDK